MRWRWASSRSAAMAVVLSAAGCGLLPATGDTSGEPPDAEEPAAQDRATPGDGPWTARTSFSDHELQLDVTAVERREDRTVLRFTLTGESERDSIFTMGMFGPITSHFSLRGLQLLDPVGQRYHYPLADPQGTRSWHTLGTRLPEHLVSGAHYQMEVHYPRLPDESGHVTLLTSRNLPPLTGIPVVDAAAPERMPSADPPSQDEIAPGDTVELPVVDGPMGDPDGGVYDLYGITEGSVIERDSSAAEERIALRADVLFEFDEDTLTGEASEVLDDIVAETAERADPDQPPITIVGHTDGVGDDGYNQDLSERRAEAVRDYLEEGLGSGYVYQTEGRGSAEPLAEEGGADDEEARARNRRVEISYQVREEYLTPEVTTGTEVTEEYGAGPVAPPAPLRWDDDSGWEPEVVGELSHADHHGLDLELEVHPFVRDGAFLIADFTLTYEGGAFNQALHGLDGADYIGADFGLFSAVDPESGQIYQGTRIGEKGGEGPGITGTSSITYVDPPGFPAAPEGEPNRAYFYLPAPPLDVDSLTFDAGFLGTVEEVPIE